MIKKANVQWTVKQLVKMTENGTIDFSNAVQRGHCWDIDRKSLFIHSLTCGYPVPAFFAVKSETGYSMLDGKQRSEAVRAYINNEYELKNVPEVILENGETLEINGNKFETLPEDLQDNIKSFSLTIYYFENITEDEIADVFYRLNNGKPLSSIELTRVKAKSIDIIKEIGKHEIFTSALTEKALSKYTNEEISIKAWVLLNTENPSFETKFVRNVITTTEITEEQKNTIIKAFDNILYVYTDISEAGDKDAKRTARKILRKTHLLSLIPIAVRIEKDGIDKDNFSEFVMSFFNSKETSINEIYNESCIEKSASESSVKERNNSLTEEYEKYFEKELKKAV